MTPALISTKEIARRLGISDRQLRRAKWRAFLKPYVYRHRGKYRRFRDTKALQSMIRWELENRDARNAKTVRRYRRKAELLEQSAERWAIGDNLVELHRRKADRDQSPTMSEVAALLGLKTAQAWVLYLNASRFPPEDRNPKLSWWHYHEARREAGVEYAPDWLALAERENLGPRQLRRLIRARASLTRTPQPLPA